MWLNSAMLTVLALSLFGCGDPAPAPTPAPAGAPREAVIPEPDLPTLACPEATTQESASSDKSVQYWCERDGVMHGPYVEYHLNDEKAASGAYVENQPDGPWIWWHDNGATEKKGKFSKGKQTGAWTWWHANGNRKEEGDFLQGRRQGQWTTYYESGLKESEGMYQNGMKNGAWTFYEDDVENTVILARNYENGEVVKEVKNKKR